MESRSWERLTLAHGTDGLYSLGFNEGEPPFQIRFEAEGYEPGISPALSRKAVTASYDIALKKINPKNAVQGVVLLPEGSPAAGVQVALCTAEKGVTLGRGRFLDQGEPILMNTDGDGRFAFPLTPNPRTVFALSDQGFGRAQPAQAKDQLTILLQPWGRIDGILKLRKESNAERQIVLFNPSNPRTRDVLLLDMSAFSTQTDRQGVFVFDQVPPGEFNLFLNRGIGQAFNHQTTVQIQSGAVANVQIGGTGGVVSGRFVFSDASRPINWAKQMASATLSVKLPALPIPRGLRTEDVEKWQTDYWRSEAGQARSLAARAYPIDVEPDGTFIAEDVPPGTYELHASLMDSNIDNGWPHLGASKSLGYIQRDLVVPESSSGAASAPMEIGTILIPSHKQ